MEKLTIFTPTYNRAYTLSNLYESLKMQTCKDFVWLIIDDGSKDNTKEVVEKFIEEGKIKIEYKYKANGGKNTAMDYSNQVCKTDYIACVDSDDLVTKECIEKILKILPIVDDDEKCVGIVSRRFKSDGKPFQDNWLDANKKIYFYELSLKYNYSADTFLIFKRKIIKNYKFPHFEKEKFVTEAIFYNQFMYDYTLYACDDNLYIGQYMEDGYTNDGLNLFFKNPMGYYYYVMNELYYSRKVKGGLKKKIALAARIFSWKKLFNYELLFQDKYKIPFIYKVIGRCLRFIPYKIHKAKYDRFLEKQNDKN